MMEVPITLIAKSNSGDVILKSKSGNLKTFSSKNSFLANLISTNFAVGDVVFAEGTLSSQEDKSRYERILLAKNPYTLNVAPGSKVIAVSNSAILFGKDGKYILLTKLTVTGRSLISSFKKGDIIYE